VTIAPRSYYGPRLREALTRDPSAPSAGFVYFIGSVDAARVKIGHSAQPFARLSHLRASSPIPLQILGVLAGVDGLEAELHQTFSSERVHGEWFSITGRVAQVIRDAFTLATGKAA